MTNQEIKPRIRNSEPECSLDNCPYYKEIYSRDSGFIKICSITKRRGMNVCIPGLRNQRDQLKAENEQLKAELEEENKLILEFAKSQQENERLRKELLNWEN